MKRILSILLCAAILIMPLCACGDDPSEETAAQTIDVNSGVSWVDDLFEEAELLYSWFTGCNRPRFDSGSAVQSGDAEYVRVTESGLNCIDDLRVRLSRVFSQGIVDSLMNTVVYSGAPMFCDIDGVLHYCTAMQGEVPWDIGTRIGSIVSQSDTEIIYRIEMTYEYYASSFSSAYDYRIVPGEDGQWRFTDFRLPAMLIAEAMFKYDQE